MKKSSIRLLAALLAGLLLAAPLTACNGGDGTETESASVSESVSDSESDTEIETAPETPNPIDLLRIGGVAIDKFTVVAPNDLAEGQELTVTDFINHVAAATGVTLPRITPDQSAEHEIIIGQNVRENEKVTAAVAEIDHDGYALVMDEGDLYISASTGRGVVYGMYDFLENYLGVRIFTADCIRYNEANIIDIPADLKDVYSPAFELRGGNSDKEFNEYGKAASKINQGDMRQFGDNQVLWVYSGHTIHDYTGTEGDGLGPNPCLSDESLYQYALQKCLAEIDAASYELTIRIGTSDNATICTCETCSAVNEAHESTGTTFMLFVNRLAKELKELRPDSGVRINTYAYVSTGTPPKDISMEDNVIVNYCLYAACFACTFDDPDCETNATIAADLKRWCEIASTVTVYDYHDNFASYQANDPGFDNILHNARWFAEIGIQGYGGERWHYNAGDFRELRTYLIRQVSWNPYMTEEEFYGYMDEFLEAYYGGAAPMIKEYITRTTENSRQSGYWYSSEGLVDWYGHSGVYTPLAPFYLAYNEDGSKNPEFTREMWTLWEEALAAELTDEQRAHVERATIHFYKWCIDFLPTKNEKKEASQRYNEYMEKYPDISML